MTAEDTHIIEQILGDQSDAGFKLLMETYQERLYWHIRRMVTFHEDANDVLQNTFIKAYKGMAGFKQTSGLYTWLYRIATNESLSFLKKNKRMTIENDDELNVLENRLRADEYFDENTALVELQKAINLLPEKQKIVFNMRYYDEMPYAEISKILETSVGALKASYHHAVKKIENYLMSKDFYAG